MTVSIYSMKIEVTAGIARHYFLSSDGTFTNSIGWGPNGIEIKGKGADLTPEQEQRVRDYPQQFGPYSISTNNCEMFAWYVVTGKRFSGQTQEPIPTAISAHVISKVQPVSSLRGMEFLQMEQAIVDRFNTDLNIAQHEKRRQDQAERDEFWRKRDAGLI